jgi:hypothetical protein
MERTTPAEKTGLGSVLSSAAEELPRRGMVILISDLFAPRAEIEEGLRVLRARRQEVIVFQVLDETELSFPFEGNTLFKGLEQFPELLVEPRALRDAYIEAVQRFLAEVRDICARQGVDYRLIHTGEPMDVAIISVIAARSRLGRRAR